MSNNKNFSKDCYCDNSKWEKKQEFSKNCCCCCQCEDKYTESKEKCECAEKFPKYYHKQEKYPKYECECCSEYDNKEYDYDYDNNYLECNSCYEQC